MIESTAFEKTAQNYYKRSGVYQRQKKNEQAIGDLDLAIQMDENFVPAYTKRAALRLKLGLCQEALEDFQAMMQKNTKDGGEKKLEDQMHKASQCAQYVAEGKNRMEQNDFAQAKQYILAAQKFAHESDTLKLLGAKCDIFSKNYQQAIVDCGSVLKANSNNLEALLWRGVAYYYGAEFEPAMVHFKKGLKTAQEHKELKKYYRLTKKLTKLLEEADAAYARNQWAKAIESWNEVLEVDADHLLLKERSYHNICKAYTNLGKGAEAVAACQKTLDIEPAIVEYWITMGDARIAAEQFDQAVADMNKAAEMDANSQNAKAGQQRAQVALKKSQRKNYYKVEGERQGE